MFIANARARARRTLQYSRAADNALTVRVNFPVVLAERCSIVYTHAVIRGTRAYTVWTIECEFRENLSFFRKIYIEVG